jgi:secreted trypsin-like serine protease
LDALERVLDAVAHGDLQVGLVSYGPASYVCGGRNNLDVGTSMMYWHGWIEDALSLYNMRG